MNSMRVRYSLQDMILKVQNVTLPEGQASYVLLTAYDQNNNEIVFEISHEQAEYLEDKFLEANRRWEMTSANPVDPINPIPTVGNFTSEDEVSTLV